MTGHEIRPLGLCALLVVAVAAPSADAGGFRTKASSHHGHSQHTRGVAIFRPQTRGLPNGVSIFRRFSGAPRASLKKPGIRNHVGHMKGDSRKRKKSLASTSEHDHAGNDYQRWEDKRRAQKAHGRPGKKHTSHASAVYVSTQAAESIDQEHDDNEYCHSLTERGYDRSGRRVLVQWTLCFDDGGEPYMPSDGRRILKRF